MSSETSPARPAPTRRTVLRGAAIGSAAWVAPVVVGATAAPAAAASPLPNVSISIWSVQREGWGSDPFKAVASFGLNRGYSWAGSVTAMFTLTDTVTGSKMTQSTTQVVPEGSQVPSSLSTDFGTMALGTYKLSVTITFNLTSYWENNQKHTGSWALEPGYRETSVTVS